MLLFKDRCQSGLERAKEKGKELQKKYSLSLRMTIVKTLTIVAFVMARRRGFRKAFGTFLIGSYWICPELPLAMIKSTVDIVKK